MGSQSQQTRASLLLQLRDARNDLAWGQFVEIYAPIVYRFCQSRGLQPADAADVSQEVMRAVSKAIKKFDYNREGGKFRNWLLTITRSKLSNFFAKREREPDPIGSTQVQARIDSEPTPDEQTKWDAEYHGRLFHWAVEQVRPTIKETTWMAFWRTMIDEEDPSNVATDLNLSIGSVYVAKSRVLARLRETIQAVDEDGGSFCAEGERP